MLLFIVLLMSLSHFSLAFMPKSSPLLHPSSSISLHRLPRSSFNMKDDKSGGNIANYFANKAPGTTERTVSITNLNRLFIRCSWISWWIQIVLSVIAGVILTFANTVRKGGTYFSFWSAGFALSSIGVGFSFLNCLWTWNITRLARRVANKSIERIKIIPTYRNYLRFSVSLSLLGMLMSLLGAEQIVGGLATKVLNSQGVGATIIANINSQNSLQALDIFLVQANTNALVAHFAPLLIFLCLQTQIPLDAEKLELSSPKDGESEPLPPVPIRPMPSV